MITIIAGSRNITNYKVLKETVQEVSWDITKIISGGAKGVDQLGIQHAFKNKIPFKVINADWNKYGRSAGPKRNIKMANEADALIALWDGKSKGTKHMIDVARENGLKTFIKMVN